MALARNLNRRSVPKSTKLPIKKIKKYLIPGLVVLAILLLIYGILNLTRVAGPQAKKQEIKYETGDKPLPQKLSIWITADDGLFMRETAAAKGKIIILVPNGTKLDVTETSGDYYKVTYMNKTGWVNKNYTTTQAPAEDPTKNWKAFSNQSFGYSLRYPTEWNVQDYGANAASNSQSYVAFGPQLPTTLDPATLPPIVVRIVNAPKAQAEAGYKTAQNVVTENVKVSGLEATKYTYNSSSGIQMTTYVVGRPTSSIILEESGGYSDELSKIINSLNLG